MSKVVRQFFICGTDTDVGKTYVAALWAQSLVAQGLRVGVYKPAASGCEMRSGKIVSSDAVALAKAADRMTELDRVCPQRFLAPLAPHLAAAAEGKSIDRALLVRGIDYWRETSDIVLIEGAGGFFCPLDAPAAHVSSASVLTANAPAAQSTREGRTAREDSGSQSSFPTQRVGNSGRAAPHTASYYIGDLARDLSAPLILVARNALGTINHTLLTLAAARAAGLVVVGIVLNRTTPPGEGHDPSVATNAAEIRARGDVPWVVELPYQAKSLPGVDGFELTV